MGMRFKVVSFTLAANVAPAGTLAVGYPQGYSAGDFKNGLGHLLLVQGGIFRNPQDFTISWGATAATLTNNSTSTWLAGQTGRMQFDMLSRKWNDDQIFGEVSSSVGASGGLGTNRIPTKFLDNVCLVDMLYFDLGSPIASSSTSIAASQSVGAGASFVLNGTLVTSGVGNLDAPRNIVAAWTTASVITVTGTDVYGQTLIEQSASGTSFTGKKAFQTVTSITSSVAITGATVGHGNVLGLPAYLANSTLVLKELQDEAAPTAGTIVAGLSQNTKSTATTADVRGSYTPNASCDGTTSFALIVASIKSTYLGNPQYSG